MAKNSKTYEFLDNDFSDQKSCGSNKDINLEIYFSLDHILKH